MKKIKGMGEILEIFLSSVNQSLKFEADARGHVMKSAKCNISELRQHQ